MQGTRDLTSKPPTRAERVVRDVLEATLDELAKTGFAALSVEAVAVRAGVNKTTIYRRWPTKGELVTAALVRFSSEVETPDTGTVRGDLLALAASGRALISTRRGRGLLRTMLAEGITPALREISRNVHKRQDAQYDLILRRGVARGELPAKMDRNIVADAIKGTLMHRMLLDRGTFEPRYVRRLVDLVLAGAAMAGAARATQSARTNGASARRARD
jgi:AcrR family transcriptional regulator